MIDAHCQHLQRRGLANTTIGVRRRKLELVDAYRPLSVLQTEDIERYLDGRNLSAKSRYDWVSHLGNFFRWAIAYGHLGHDPTATLVRPKLRRGLPRPIGDGDLALAIQMAGPVMQAWLCLGAFGGLRCAEIAGLEVGDVLWGDGLLRVTGKGDKERLVPLHDDVVTALRACPLPKRGPLFRRPRGGPYPAAQVSREVSVYLEGLGISATAHQLRHWFGTNVYRTSHDLRVTQELMGHASPTTTAIYADWSRAEAARAVQALSSPAVGDSLFSDWAG